MKLPSLIGSLLVAMSVLFVGCASSPPYVSPPGGIEVAHPKVQALLKEMQTFQDAVQGPHRKTTLYFYASIEPTGLDETYMGNTLSSDGHTAVNYEIMTSDNTIRSAKTATVMVIEEKGLGAGLERRVQMVWLWDNGHWSVPPSLDDIARAWNGEFGRDSFQALIYKLPPEE